MSGTLAMGAQVEVAQVTDPGRDPDKQVNEDTCRYDETPFGHLAVVCDGMGGHEGGREASLAAVAAVFRYVHAAATRDDLPRGVRAREVLRDAITLANHDVAALASAHSATHPGSTIVALLLHREGVEVAHVGDSRCYVVRAGDVRQITRDHSMVQQMVDAGKLTREEADVHPDANRITRALGVGAVVAVEVQPSSIAYASGDTFVLCSDGLSDLVKAPEIGKAAAGASPSSAARELVDLANARGGHDNITVVLVRAHSAAVPSGAEAGGLPSDVPAARALPPTEAMPAVPAPSSRPAPPGTASAPPDSHPLLPPAPRSQRAAARAVAPARRFSPVVVAGLLLAAVGVVAVAAVVREEVAPARQRNDVPGLSLSIVLPAASLSPGGAAPSDDEADGGPDGGGRGHRFRNPRRK